jgi:hypothetical protein
LILLQGIKCLIKCIVFTIILLNFVLQIAFAQSQINQTRLLSNKLNSSNNFFSVNVPSNTTSLEIKLKSEKPLFPSESNINSLIAIGGVIAGGITGSVLTYLSTTRIEKNKEEKEKQKETTFNNTIRLLAYSELKSYYDVFSKNFDINNTNKTLQINGDLWIVKDDIVGEIKQILDSLPIHYNNIVVEKRASVFEGEDLIKVESAYLNFRNFKFNKFSGHEGGFYQSQINVILNSLKIALRLFDDKII